MTGKLVAAGTGWEGLSSQSHSRTARSCELAARQDGHPCSHRHVEFSMRWLCSSTDRIRTATGLDVFCDPHMAPDFEAAHLAQCAGIVPLTQLLPIHLPERTFSAAGPSW